MDKKIVRTNILQVRNGLTEEECRNKSHDILRRLLERDDVKCAGVIGLYASYGSEVCTDEMFEILSHKGVITLFPKVLKNHQMEFRRVNSKADLISGFRGIMEPSPDTSLWEEPDLLIVPVVAFDSQCMRVGYGGGYYDRYLSCHSQMKTIGVAYECQKVDNICAEETDRSLDCIVTEEKTYE